MDLPRLTDQLGARPATEITIACLSKGETILLVEDDQLVCFFVAQMLTELGYTVLACEQPARTLEQPADPALKLDLLLSDVIMPALDGRELAERFRTLRPGVKILFMPGYPDRVLSEEYLLESKAG